jgi:hypothetical protein
MYWYKRNGTQFLRWTRPETATQLLGRYLAPVLRCPISYAPSSCSCLLPCLAGFPVRPTAPSARFTADQTLTTRVPLFFPVHPPLCEKTSNIEPDHFIRNDSWTWPCSTTSKSASSGASGEYLSPPQSILFLASIYFALRPALRHYDDGSVSPAAHRRSTLWLTPVFCLSISFNPRYFFLPPHGERTTTARIEDHLGPRVPPSPLSRASTSLCHDRPSPSLREAAPGPSDVVHGTTSRLTQHVGYAASRIAQGATLGALARHLRCILADFLDVPSTRLSQA